MLKCVIFDLGNTLVDFHDAERMARAYARIFRKHGYKTKYDAVKKARGEEAKKHHSEHYGTTRRHHYHLLVRRVLFALGYVVSEKEAMRLEEEISADLTKGNRLFPGVRNVLGHIRRRKLKTVLVCNGTRRWVDKQLEKFMIADFFDCIIISDELGKEKSSLLPFRAAAKKLNVEPRECLMVGDRIDEDMHARRLGMLTCLAAYGAKLPVLGHPEKPDFVIKDIRKLTGIIKKIEKQSS